MGSIPIIALTAHAMQAHAYILPDSSFHEGLADVLRWHAENPDDWRATRQKVNDKYYRYRPSIPNICSCPLCSMPFVPLLRGRCDF